jgi:hypothetical protein
MHNGYTQAEGVANLHQVPETGCLVVIGYPKFGGGLGGYARYIAICPADWKYGVSVGDVPEAPLAKSDKRLQWDEQQGMRVRKQEALLSVVRASTCPPLKFGFASDTVVNTFRTIAQLKSRRISLRSLPVSLTSVCR